MKLVLLGLNHRTAPVAVRERYAVPAARLCGLVEQLSKLAGIGEAAIISTCNRTELLVTALDAAAAREALTRFLHAEIGNSSAGPDQIYDLEEREVVEHLFRVAASLDSMVVGEAQILGQLKDAYRGALAARGLGPLLNRLFQHSFRAAKRVRSETGLGTSSVSVARVGVQLARRLFESFEGKRVLLLGAGTMAEAALAGLRDAGAREFSLVNRTPETARRLALRFGGEVHGLDALETELARADVVLSSIQVDRPLLESERLGRVRAARFGKPMLLIDLGVPRNIAPAVNDLEDVYLFDLDDFEAEAERGRAQRADALPAAQGIISAEVDAYERWRSALPLVPTIQRLRERIEAQVRAELAVNGLPPAAAERLAEGIMAKILHEPLERLRREAEEAGGDYYAEALHRLFALEGEET